MSTEELTALVKSIVPADAKLRPCSVYNKRLDTVVFLEKDCSYTEEWFPESNISLLRENHDPAGEPGRVVGVIISGWSHWIKSGFLPGF